MEWILVAQVNIRVVFCEHGDELFDSIKTGHFC
jgi:hypothetical protein